MPQAGAAVSAAGRENPQHTDRHLRAARWRFKFALRHALEHFEPAFGAQKLHFNQDRLNGADADNSALDAHKFACSRNTRVMQRAKHRTDGRPLSLYFEVKLKGTG